MAVNPPAISTARAIAVGSRACSFMLRSKAELYNDVKPSLLVVCNRHQENKAMLDNPAHAGSRLRQAIKSLPTTNAALADEVGVSPQAVGYWIKTGNIARERVAAIVEFLRISADWLLSGKGPMRPKPQTVSDAGIASEAPALLPLNRGLLIQSVQEVLEAAPRRRRRDGPSVADIAETIAWVYEDYLAEQGARGARRRDAATVLRLVSSR